MNPVLVSLAGSLGAVTRFVLDGHIRAKHNHTFPWATLVINITGSFVLGLVTGIMLNYQTFSGTATVIGAGFCGGYTTFSTASFETVRLLEKRRYIAALGNAAGSIALTVLAAAAGLALGLAV